MTGIRNLTATCCPLLIAVCSAAAAEGTLTMELEVGPGTGDNPMIVVWLEKLNGDFVRTLQLFSKDAKYFHEMTLWWSRHDGNAADRIDAVIGPTIKWTSSRSATIPLVIGDLNLLDGSYQLHIEQRRDKGGHYKKMRVPLPTTFSSGKVKGEGYLSQITFTVKR